MTKLPSSYIALCAICDRTLDRVLYAVLALRALYTFSLPDQYMLIFDGYSSGMAPVISLHHHRRVGCAVLIWMPGSFHHM